MITNGNPTDNHQTSTNQMQKVDVISGKIEGSILGNKYKVGRFLDRGENGQIYKAKNTKMDDASRIVIKVQRCIPMIMQEIQMLCRVSQVCTSNPKNCEKKGRILGIKDWGHFINQDYPF